MKPASRRSPLAPASVDRRVVVAGGASHGIRRLQTMVIGHSGVADSLSLEVVSQSLLALTFNVGFATAKKAFSELDQWAREIREKADWYDANGKWIDSAHDTVFVKQIGDQLGMV